MRLAPFWRRRARSVIDAEAGRRDLRRHLHAYVDALALRAHGNGTAALTRAEAALLLGVTERTVSKLRRWLADRGLLTTLEHGSTPATRRAPAEEGNRCAVYVLTSTPDAGDAEATEIRCRSSQVTRKFTPPLASARGERTTAARARVAAVCAAAGVSGGWLDRQVRALGLEVLSPEELARVLTFAPDGSRWTFGAGQRRPIGAVRWCLRLWGGLLAAHGLDGLRRGPLPDPGAAAAAWQARVAEAEALRTAQAARRARHAADQAVAVPMPASLRAQLAAQRERRLEDRGRVSA